MAVLTQRFEKCMSIKDTAECRHMVLGFFFTQKAELKSRLHDVSFFIFPFFLFFLSPCFLPLFSFRSSISFLFFLFPLFLFCSSFPCFPLSFFLFLSLFFPCEIQNKSKIINPLSHSAYRKAHAYIPISSSPWIKLLYRNILTTMLNFPGFRVEFVPASYILF